MAMLTLNGVVQNVYHTPESIDKKTSEAVKNALIWSHSKFTLLTLIESLLVKQFGCLSVLSSTVLKFSITRLKTSHCHKFDNEKGPASVDALRGHDRFLFRTKRQKPI
jgi:hypothetical protein